jgi:hypothetical protein
MAAQSEVVNTLTVWLPWRRGSLGASVSILCAQPVELAFGDLIAEGGRRYKSLGFCASALAKISLNGKARATRQQRR